MSAWTSETHALEAVRWAKKPYPANPVRTNWDEWLERLKTEARKPYKQTIMRNQSSMGMNNNLWPALSRFTLMAEPETFGSLIKPRHISALDSPTGIELLNELFHQITGSNPKVYDWRYARKKR